MTTRIHLGLGAAALALLALAAPARASSHREALAVLNDPCIDNTDVYAWVTPGARAGESPRRIAMSGSAFNARESLPDMLVGRLFTLG